MAKGLLLAVLVGLLSVACRSSAPDAGAGAWVGSITTSGDVTTVINESGSIWRGNARLVEEASIGVELGAEEYMLGAISNVVADDERIYVIEPNKPAIRMDDHAGTFVGMLGREGQGPGEYKTPIFMAVADDGRKFVYEDSRKVLVYGADDQPLETWPVAQVGCCAWPMLLGPSAALWLPIVEWEYQREGRGGTRWGTQQFGPDGYFGPQVWPADDGRPPMSLTFIAGDRQWGIAFSPSVTFGIAGPGMMASGYNDAYRFRLDRQDGAVTIIERAWQPITIDAEHREWMRRYTIASVRESADPGFQWDGAEMPDHQPAFYDFVPGPDDGVLVVRAGPSRRRSDCVEDPLEGNRREARNNPCWGNDVLLDAFDADGRFLGSIEGLGMLPSFATEQLAVFAGDGGVTVVKEDEAGTVMVKRYRVELPARR